MFEQTFVSTPAAKQNPWAFGLSVTAQCGLLAVLLAIPLWFSDALPADNWTRFRIATPPRPEAPPPDVVQTTSARPERFDPTHAFVQPRRIPDQVDMTAEAPRVTSDFPYIFTGLPPGTGGDGVFGGITSTSAGPVIPKPQPNPEPQPDPPAPKSVRVSSGAQAANLIRRVTPTYPPIARQAGIQGTVQLVAVITRDGRISELRVVAGHPLLVQAARSAVSQWRYRPFLLNGQPVELITTIDVNFRLNR